MFSETSKTKSQSSGFKFMWCVMLKSCSKMPKIYLSLKSCWTSCWRCDAYVMLQVSVLSKMVSCWMKLQHNFLLKRTVFYSGYKKTGKKTHINDSKLFNIMHLEMWRVAKRGMRTKGNLHHQKCKLFQMHSPKNTFKKLTSVR